MIWTSDGSGSYVYNPPPEDGWYYLTAYSANDSSFFSSSAALAGGSFENLTFSNFSDYVLSTRADGIVFKNCRFLANNTSGNKSYCVLSVTDAACTFEDCVFEACPNGVKVTSSTEKTCTVEDCRFSNTKSAGAYVTDYSSGLFVAGSVRPEITGCTFRRLYVSTASANKPLSAALSLATSWPAVVSNCVFSTCSIAADATATLTVSSNQTVVIDGCQFLANSASIDNGGYAHSCCVGHLSGGNTIFRNSYFSGNTMTASAGSGNAVLYCNAIFGSFSMVNCTVENNCATGTTAAIGIEGSWRTQQSGFANCLFQNNTVMASGTRYPELRNCYTGDAGNATGAMFVNTIFWNDAEDYIPFTKAAVGSDAARKIGVARSIIKNYTPETSGLFSGFFYAPISDKDPLLAAGISERDGHFSRGLTAMSPTEARRSGIPIHLATDGYCYFLDTHQSPNVWRRIASCGAMSYSLEGGAAVGLTAGMKPYPDAFGEERPVSGKMALGPLNAPLSALSIIVR